DQSESPQADEAATIGQSTVYLDPTFQFGWLAPVINSGDAQLCNLGIQATFIVDGEEVGVGGAVYAPVYMSELGSSVTCLDPGDTGVLWGFPTTTPRSFEIAAIEEIRYHFVGLPSDP